MNRVVTRLALAGLLSLWAVAGCQNKNQATTPRFFQVTLIADGQTRQLTPQADTVGGLLAEAGVTLGDLDQVEPPEYTPLTDGMTIRVVRIQHVIEPGEEIVIPFERQLVQDTSVPAGESRILDPGQNGLEQIIYRVVYQDGVEVERVPVRRVTLQEAHPETVLVGAREAFTPTPIAGTIAYITGNAEVGFNAWVMRGSSGAQRRLTSDGTLDTRVFALSPDGTRLMFTRRTSPVGAEPQDAAPQQLNSLWLIDTTDEDAEPIPLGVNDILWADWSPDGDTIAYATAKATVGLPGWQALNDLWLAELNPQLHTGGRSRNNLVRRQQLLAPAAGGAYSWWGTDYVWSPNGNYIAYAQADNIGYVRVADGKRTELHRFDPLRTYSQWVWLPQMSWSPDNRFLTAVVHGPSATGEAPEDSPVFDLWVFDIQRPLSIKQVSEVGMWATPRWSPALTRNVGDARFESRIAYARARSPFESVNSTYDLYVMDRDGSNRRRVFPSPDQVGVKSPRIAWSPTGQQLLTVYQDDLYLIDLARDAIRRLTVDSSVQFFDWAQ